MKQFKVQIHSMVDVITNSSTVIYVTTQKDAVEQTKEMINFFLKASGCDHKADDLFTFEMSFTNTDLLLDLICDEIEEYPESAVLAKDSENSDNWDSDKVGKIAEDILTRMTYEEKSNLLSGSDADLEDTVIVKSKNDEGNSICMSEAFLNIFSAEEGGY